MLEFAHFLDRALHLAAPYLIAVAVILWAIAFGTAAVDAGRRPLGAPQLPPVFVWGALGFLSIVLSLCANRFFLQQSALNELRPRLDTPVRQIQVNGSPALDPERLLRDLRQVTSRNYHHSHPTASYRVQLQTSEGELELTLRRDSAVPNEYWVFYPGFGGTETGEIGTVLTEALESR